MITHRYILPFIAFVSGFSLMAFELAAARVLAPSIGSSTYVWTSVIGVIIAALSLGYWMGGKLADARNRATDIVWLMMATSIVILLTLIMYPIILSWVTGGILDARMQGVIASLILFAPASFLLGMLAPYLVKLKITTLETSGVSYASLSAMESIGGIAGTFITGFVLFSFIGSRETFAVVVLLLVGASWLLVWRHRLVLRLVATMLIAAVGVLGLLQAQPHEIDTPSAHYTIVEGEMNGHPVRGISSGPNGTQSGVYINDKDRLLFWYSQQMAETVESAPHHDSILVLGGGTFTLPRYLAGKYPDSSIDVVEIDPELADVAREHFFYDDPSNINLIFEDARTYVNRTTKKYDVVLVDVYADASVPFSLMTREYGEQLAELTVQDGVVAANMIVGMTGACGEAYRAFDAPYRSQFPYAVFRTEHPGQVLSNVISIYSRQPIALKADKIEFTPIVPYTDNYAPAERIQQACSNQLNAPKGV